MSCCASTPVRRFQVAHEVSVDVVGMVFVFYERAVGENFADANPPKLARENLQIIDQSFPPRLVPRRVCNRIPRTGDENRLAEFVEGQFIVGGRKEAICVKGWDRSHC